jgi:anti-anti-sigma regulatory factor
LRELVIGLAGDYDVCTMQRLCREIEPAANWATGVVIDLTRVKFIDATCANELIKIFEERDGVGSTRFVVPDEATRELFLLLGLDERSMQAGAHDRARAHGFKHLA